MSSTYKKNYSRRPGMNSHGNKDLLKEQARQLRQAQAMQALRNKDTTKGSGVPLFAEPVRKSHPVETDPTRKQIERVLGEYDKVRPYVQNAIHLIGVPRQPMTPQPSEFIESKDLLNRSQPLKLPNGISRFSLEASKLIQKVDSSNKIHDSGSSHSQRAGSSVPSSRDSSHKSSASSSMTGEKPDKRAINKQVTKKHSSRANTSSSNTPVNLNKSDSSWTSSHSHSTINSPGSNPNHEIHSQKVPSSPAVVPQLDINSSKSNSNHTVSNKTKVKPSPSHRHISKGNFTPPNGAIFNGMKKSQPQAALSKLQVPLDIPSKPSIDELQEIFMEMTHIETPLTAIHTPRKEEKFPFPPSTHKPATTQTVKKGPDPKEKLSVSAATAAARGLEGTVSPSVLPVILGTVTGVPMYQHSSRQTFEDLVDDLMVSDTDSEVEQDDNCEKSKSPKHEVKERSFKQSPSTSSSESGSSDDSSSASESESSSSDDEAEGKRPQEASASPVQEKPAQSWGLQQFRGLTKPTLIDKKNLDNCTPAKNEPEKSQCERQIGGDNMDIDSSSDIDVEKHLSQSREEPPLLEVRTKEFWFLPLLDSQCKSSGHSEASKKIGKSPSIFSPDIVLPGGLDKPFKDCELPRDSASDKQVPAKTEANLKSASNKEIFKSADAKSRVSSGKRKHVEIPSQDKVAVEHKLSSDLAKKSRSIISKSDTSDSDIDVVTTPKGKGNDLKKSCPGNKKFVRTINFSLKDQSQMNQTSKSEPEASHSNKEDCERLPERKVSLGNDVREMFQNIYVPVDLLSPLPNALPPFRPIQTAKKSFMIKINTKFLERIPTLPAAAAASPEYCTNPRKTEDLHKDPKLEKQHEELSQIQDKPKLFDKIRIPKRKQEGEQKDDTKRCKSSLSSKDPKKPENEAQEEKVTSEEKEHCLSERRSSTSSSSSRSSSHKHMRLDKDATQENKDAKSEKHRDAKAQKHKEISVEKHRSTEKQNANTEKHKDAKAKKYIVEKHKDSKEKRSVKPERHKVTDLEKPKDSVKEKHKSFSQEKSKDKDSSLEKQQDLHLDKQKSTNIDKLKDDGEESKPKHVSSYTPKDSNFTELVDENTLQKQEEERELSKQKDANNLEMQENERLLVKQEPVSTREMLEIGVPKHSGNEPVPKVLCVSELCKVGASIMERHDAIAVEKHKYSSVVEMQKDRQDESSVVSEKQDTSQSKICHNSIVDKYNDANLKKCKNAYSEKQLNHRAECEDRLQNLSQEKPVLADLEKHKYSSQQKVNSVSNKIKKVSAATQQNGQLESAAYTSNGLVDHRSESKLDPVKTKPLLKKQLLEEKSADSYLHDAKRLKHQADNLSDKLTKSLTYIEAVLSFVLCGYKMGIEKISGNNQIFTMYRDTLMLLTHICKFRSSDHDKEKKLSVLSLRIQSILCLRLYTLKKPEAVKCKKAMDEHNKSSSSRAHAPSPRQANWNNRNTGTPSSISPTPSPAGSIGSVGSQGSSSDLCTSKIPNGNIGCGSNMASPHSVSVPQRIHSITQSYQEIVNYLVQCHDFWEKAELAIIDSRDFFNRIDEECGELKLNSSIYDLVQYVKYGLQLLKES